LWVPPMPWPPWNRESTIWRPRVMSCWSSDASWSASIARQRPFWDLDAWHTCRLARWTWQARGGGGGARGGAGRGGAGGVGRRAASGAAGEAAAQGRRSQRAARGGGGGGAAGPGLAAPVAAPEPAPPTRACGGARAAAPAPRAAGRGAPPPMREAPAGLQCAPLAGAPPRFWAPAGPRLAGVPRRTLRPGRAPAARAPVTLHELGAGRARGALARRGAAGAGRATRGGAPGRTHLWRWSCMLAMLRCRARGERWRTVGARRDGPPRGRFGGRGGRGAPQAGRRRPGACRGATGGDRAGGASVHAQSAARPRVALRGPGHPATAPHRRAAPGQGRRQAQGGPPGGRGAAAAAHTRVGRIPPSTPHPSPAPAGAAAAGAPAAGPRAELRPGRDEGGRPATASAGRRAAPGAVRRACRSQHNPLSRATPLGWARGGVTGLPGGAPRGDPACGLRAAGQLRGCGRHARPQVVRRPRRPEADPEPDSFLVCAAAAPPDAQADDNCGAIFPAGPTGRASPPVQGRNRRETRIAARFRGVRAAMARRPPSRNGLACLAVALLAGARNGGAPARFERV
jgi:hypothetical protein